MGMPSDLYSFTKKILLGNTREDPGQQRDKYDVNLISIGFAFTSVELIELLRDHPRLRVFHVNLETGDNPSTLHEQVREIGEVEQYFIDRSAGEPDRTELFPRSRRPSPRPAGAVPRTHDMFSDDTGRASWPGTRWSTRCCSARGRRRTGRRCGSRRPRGPPEPACASPKRTGTISMRGCAWSSPSPRQGERPDRPSTLVDDRDGIYFGKWRECETRGVTSLRTICTTFFRLRDDRGYGGNIFTIPPVGDLFVPDEQLRTALAEWDANEGMMEGTSEFAYGIWFLLRGRCRRSTIPCFRRTSTGSARTSGRGSSPFSLAWSTPTCRLRPPVHS